MIGNRNLRLGVELLAATCALSLLALAGCGGGGGGTSTSPSGTLFTGATGGTTGTEMVLYSFASGADGSSPYYSNLIQASDGNFYGVTLSGGLHGQGTVFQLTASGVESVLHSFGGSGDGALPYGSLIQAADGNLYGMTSGGGANGAGTIFRYSPASAAESVLYSFAGGTTDGSAPYGSLIQTADGNLYGMTWGGGASSVGAIFRYSPASAVETMLYSFAGGPGDGANPHGSLIQAADGNLYGMTWGGGASSVGAMFRYSPASAVETVLYSFAGGSGDGANPHGDLVQATDGNFYGMTYGGGSAGFGTVFRITPTGAESVLHSFAGNLLDGGNPYGNLIQGTDGNLYGLTAIGGSSNTGTEFRITTGGTETLLHGFTMGTGDGLNPYGSLIQASDRYFYGMTNAGGSHNAGAVFRVN